MKPADDILSNVMIGNYQLTWRELAARRAEEITRLSKFATLVADLDRNINGRHEGDFDSLGPSGVSHGNPLIATGTVFAYAIHGTRGYAIPDPSQRHNPDAWLVNFDD